jgi:hypothetical protein
MYLITKNMLSLERETMNEILTLFGDNAGKVWQTLHEQGPCTEADLLEKTHLTESQLCAAIGWLARENKIRKENNTFTLGETNLLPAIGKDAGKVWHALDIWGEIDAQSLSHLSRIEAHDVFTAVGWLAREGKVDGTIKNITEEKILFRLT